MDGAPGQDEGELGRVDGTGEESWYVAVLPFPSFSLPLKSNSPLPSSRPTPPSPLNLSQELGRGKKTRGRTELTRGGNSVLYRLRRPRAPRPAPARRRLEGRRVHGARRRGQLRVVRRDTHGSEGNPGDHE
jgi:hypothetical protein